MSYMREPYYVYDSEHGCEFHTDHIAHDEMDAIALMRIGKIMGDTADPGRLRRAVEIVKANEGNFGSHEFLTAIGIDAKGNLKRWIEAVRYEEENS